MIVARIPGIVTIVFVSLLCTDATAMDYSVKAGHTASDREAKSVVANADQTGPRSTEPRSTEPRSTEPRLISSGGFPTLGGQRTQAETENADPSGASSRSFATPMVTTCSALAVVLGLFASLVWISRKYGSKTLAGTLPSDLIQVLGTSAMDAKTQITLIRIGNRVVVAARNGESLQTLTQFDDIDEVNQLTARCTGNAKVTFDAALQDFQNEPTDGFAEAAAPRTRGRLFATA